MERVCTHCREPREAQSLCTYCNKWLCYQCTDMHQDHRTAGPLLLPGSGKRPAQIGPSCWSSGVPLCHFHRQEPLDLFCETCDLMSCSSCHLSTHMDHRVVHVGKALQDQLWLFENLMVQVEDKKSTVENAAKQIEDRLHGVKIMQRKAENQIKMAKMIMINELNKRANLLIEQLERVSSEFKQHLDEQLQGMIDMCSQLGHMQNFISWAISHHQRNPLLFSKDLIAFQMQRILESRLHTDLGPPVKIKFNWDASFWTKQISTIGQVTTEGGSYSHSVGMACPSILKPQPIVCTALPTSMCHRALDQGCSFQPRFQPQLCCPHCVNVSKAPQAHLDLLMGHGREPLDQEARCHPIRLYSERSRMQLPKQSEMQLRKKHSEPSPCPATCVESSQSLPPQLSAQSQVPLDPPCPPAPVTHVHQHPQQQVLVKTQPATADARLRSSSSSPPGKQQPAQPSPQLLPQTSHQPRAEQPSSGQAQPAADRSCAPPEQTGADPPADVGTVGGGRQQKGEPPCMNLQIQRPSAPALAPDQRAEAETLLKSSCRGSSLLEAGAQTSTHGPPSSTATGPRPLQGRSLESRKASEEPATKSPSLPEARATGANSSLATAAREQKEGDPQSSERSTRAVSDGAGQGAAQVGSFAPPPPGQCSSAPSTCQTKPGKMYACEDTGTEGRARLKISRKRLDVRTSRDTRKGPKSSRVPLVHLERLRIRLMPGKLSASRPAPRAQRRSGPLPKPQLTTEGAVTPEPQRIYEHHQRKGRPKKQTEQCTEVSHPFSQPERPKEHPANSTDFRSAGITQCPEQERLQEEPSLPPCNPEPESNPGLESESELQFESDPNLELEPELESEPQLRSEQQPESDPSLDSEPHQELYLDAELEHQPGSDPSLESEARAELDSDLELVQQAVSEPSLEPEPDVVLEHGSDPDQEPAADLVSEPGAVPGPLSEREERVDACERTDWPAAGGGAQGEAAEMENEDFCAVCLNGGDLLCCDHCPKVFHLSCHVPPLLSFPTGDWVCSLCRDVQHPEMEYDCENTRLTVEHAGKGGPYGLSDCDLRRCEKLTLFISSNILSGPFHEPVSPLARHYYQIIKKPMDLSVIRSKLNRKSHLHYYTPEEFVADVFLMFRNCAKFNYPDSEVAQAGRSLEAFFKSKLKEVFKDKTFPALTEDSDSEEYEDFYRSGLAGFPWPDRKEHCHRKRKRRHSLNTRRHHF